jgi:translation initiation factor IF-2
LAVKKRVFQVAREFNVSNEAIIACLAKADYDIRNQMSPLPDEAYELIVEKFGAKPLQVDADYEFRKKLRDRKVQEELKREEAKRELERRIQASKELAKEMPKLKKQKEEAARVADEAARAEKAAKLSKAEAELLAEEKPEEKPKKPKKVLRVVEIPPEESSKRPKAKEEAFETPTQKAKVKPGSEAEAKGGEAAAPGKAAPGEEEKDKKKKRKRRRKKRAVEPGEIDESLVAVADHKRKRVKKKKKPTFNEEEIQETIRQTLAAIDEAGKPRRKRRRSQVEEDEEVDDSLVIRVSEFMSIAELAKLMNVEPSDLIKKCMELGMMVSINQRLDMDSITLLASEYGYEVEALAEFGEDILEAIEETDEEDGNLLPRPPVVTIMGHVDHGKTSLLDYIRKSNIIAGEAGGITQHIGAYEVLIDSKAITFLDTPGHEAFTAMRARGAQVTDIVVLVVAADDSVMPQTIEAISHAKAAGVPIIVAINKVDKPGANPDMIRKQLADHGVLVEQWGGKYQSVELSAKTGQSVDQLLEMILLEAEVLDLKANPGRKAHGAIIESRLDRGKGVVASVLVQNGTLQIGDPFIAGTFSGKVRSMFDERGKRVKAAGPSVPVQVLGFDGMPQAGDTFIVLKSERDTKDISQKRQQLQREHEHWRSRPRTLDEISKQIQKGQVRQLLLVLKADVDGSIEAITDSLLKLTTSEVGVDIIHRGVGAISESDVLLASASGAIIIGFNVRPTTKARELSSKEEVDIRLYEVIYDIINDVKAALEGFLEPTISEELVGSAEVRQVFKVPKVGAIAGCYITTGKINRNDNIKLYRDDRLIHDGKISSLKRFKDDVREISNGFECGIGIERFDDLKVSDIIEAYKIVETKRTLA